LHEVRPGTGQPAIDEEWLLGLDKVGVNGKNPRPGIGSTSVRATTSSAGFARWMPVLTPQTWLWF